MDTQQPCCHRKRYQRLRGSLRLITAHGLCGKKAIDKITKIQCLPVFPLLSYRHTCKIQRFLRTLISAIGG